MTETNPESNTTPSAAADELQANDQILVRAAKREQFLEQDVSPYPASVPVTATIGEVREKHGELEPGAMTEDVVGVAGRIVFQRNTGKLCFATLQSGDGTRIQVMLSLAEVGEEQLASYKALVDLGDHVFVQGAVGASRRGELSIFATEWRMAAKALRPLPVLHADLSEESRVRQRYVDLIVRPQARDMVQLRADVNRSLRESFHKRKFLELETPMLQAVASGAAARPFQTHLNAFDLDVFLRIAPELFLKRAVVGGVERAFEINRNFRNEGSDSTHSPEFVMLEAYQAYGDYNSIGTLTRELVQEAADNALGTQVVTLANGEEYDFSGEWAQLSMYDSLSEALGHQVTPQDSRESLLKIASSFELDFSNPKFSHGKIIEELWEHCVGSTLSAPTFVRDFPVDTSPLTREHRTIPGVVEKWDLYVRGFELATGYSELVDPVVQRERFAAQAQMATLGDDEAMPLDEDFLRAMEFAMPPSGGMGMGLDRLLIAFTGLGIRDTILFPFVKPNTER